MATHEKVDDKIFEVLKDTSIENLKRHEQAENIVGEYLRKYQSKYQFRHEQVIKDYIFDFVSLPLKLAIDIDPKHHFTNGQMVSDEQRIAEIEALGYQIISLSNQVIIDNTAIALATIKRNIMQPNKKQPSVAPKAPSRKPAANRLTPEGAAVRQGWAVDAACSGNPGPMEYRGVDMSNGAQLFHFGPMQGTNNIGEFLAIVHALALMDQLGIKDKPIYSDSYNAILWVSKKQCKTKMARTPQTEELFRIIARAEQWLRTHAIRVPVLKWETAKWGESPADFGRK